ncbi:MAG: alcohol dehydrogenase catalytic domain-containing protein [Bacteroidetes bacterium]|nr:alcohol dehydrogenase catalytic domain-containing protein [Bacteroidota bacterium]
MKALFFDGSLALKDISTPEPRGDEVLIRILYSAICNTDLEILKGYMGFTGIPGHEFVGEVVTPHRKLSGRVVVGEINCPCGECYLCKTGRRTHCTNRSVLGIDHHAGVFADFMVLPEENLHIIPQNLSPVAAVFTEPLAAALEIFEQIRIKPSQTVFIFGAGKLGLLISQVFRLHGCDYKTFDSNPAKVVKAVDMGLNAFLASSLAPADKAEVCIDCTGSPEGIRVALEHLYPRGRLVLKTTIADPELIDLNQIVINEFNITGSRCGPFAPALNLLSHGFIDPEPLITKIFEFSEILKAFECAALPDTIKVVINHG